MMDLIVLGIFAFWIGKNLDGFDFDFTQNQDEDLDTPTNQDPSRFTEWEKRRQEIDPKYPPRTVYSLWARQYKQIHHGQDVILFEQFQIKKNEEVFRTGYNNLKEALEQYEEMIRPRTPQEQKELEEINARKNFEVHNMYSPKGIEVEVTSYEQHLELEALGYTVSPPTLFKGVDNLPSKGGAL